ncbi:MAG: hypothetical protein PVI28_19220 [Gammaproteobacteria bacterium]|jgi:hypothetical protein
MSLGKRIEKLEEQTSPPEKRIVVMPLKDGESEENAMERYIANGGKKPVGGRPYILFADSVDLNA